PGRRTVQRVQAPAAERLPDALTRPETVPPIRPQFGERTCAKGARVCGLPPHTLAAARFAGSHSARRQAAVSATADQAGARSLAERLGIQPGQMVQELGYDEDADEELRSAIAERAGNELLDEESDEVVDVVLLWWREGDGDLVDALVDAIGPLAESGVVWLLTPKNGREGYVEPSEISEAAPTAGLQQTSTLSAGPDWTGTRLVSPKAKQGRSRR